MTNEKLKEILRDCSKEKLVPIGNSLQHQRQVDYEQFAKEIVGETVMAIITADCSQFTKTTYDKDFVDGVLSAVIDSVRNYWDFKE